MSQTQERLDLTEFVRAVLDGAIGDRALPFRSILAADRAAQELLAARCGRALTHSEQAALSIEVCRRWTAPVEECPVCTACDVALATLYIVDPIERVNVPRCDACAPSALDRYPAATVTQIERPSFRAVWVDAICPNCDAELHVDVESIGSMEVTAPGECPKCYSTYSIEALTALLMKQAA